MRLQTALFLSRVPVANPRLDSHFLRWQARPCVPQPPVSTPREDLRGERSQLAESTRISFLLPHIFMPQRLSASLGAAMLRACFTVDRTLRTSKGVGIMSMPWPTDLTSMC